MKLNTFFYDNFNLKNIKICFISVIVKIVFKLLQFSIFFRDGSGSIIFFYTKNFYLESLLLFLKFSNLVLLKILNDITAVDLFSKKISFKFIYTLRSYKYNILIFISFFLKSLNILVSSINYLFSSSNWPEREIYDLFGIQFINNFDLRRILTDYGFQGHPLKKDFPLMGFVEIFHSFVKREICYRPIPKSAQTLRFFNFHSDWENFY